MTNRREVLKTMGAVSLVGVGERVSAAESSRKTVSVTLSNGKSVSAYLAEPGIAPVAGGVVVIHEGRGLTHWEKDVARKLAGEGFLALAVDLYEGKVASTGAQARSIRKKLDKNQIIETLVRWTEWLRDHSGNNGKIGVAGWCYGGYWSLVTSSETPVQATVFYYGNCEIPRWRMERLEGPVLGHFATRDDWITRQMVEKFQNKMDAAGKLYESHWYDADHAFANKNYSIYDQQDARRAWKRTVAFFRTHLS